MTIREAIARCDSLQHNTFSQAQKVRWLSTLEGLVYPLILAGRESPGAAFDGFDDSTDPDTPLAVPEPFSELYILYLQAMIHYYNGEPERFNNGFALFRTAWENYANYVNRTVQARPCRFRYF